MAVGINKNIERAVNSLKANRFDPVEFVEKADTAIRLVLDMIPLEATVGVAGSTTVRQIGLVAQLKARGTTVIDVTVPSELPVDEVMRHSVRSDILLASSNAVTLDGKLVNIDQIGNRVAGMVFGPKRVILVVGTNKVVRNVDEATDRIKNVIAPYHAMTKGSKVPCATELRCTDCKSPDRLCNVTTIIEKKPVHTDIAIVLVGQDLGLGWNPTWSKERKEKIALAYRESRKGYSQALQRAPIEDRESSS